MRKINFCVPIREPKWHTPSVCQFTYVLLMFRILRHNDVTTILNWTYEFRFEIRVSNLVCVLKTNQKEFFDSVFSYGKLGGSSLTYFPVFVVL